MKSRTDFDVWLAENAPASPEDLYNLYRAVTDGTPMAQYQVSKNGERTFVRTDEAQSAQLLIANSAAKELFLVKLNKLRSQIDTTADGDMTMEGWYDYYRRTNKN